MIPLFPEFKNLELSDKEEIETITRQFPPHSDFHFISIFCWDIDNTTQVSLLNDNLVIKQIDCFTGEKFFSFIGINSVPQTVKGIADFQNQNNLPSLLRWVPEETVKCIDGLIAIVTEDRDYFDYIYDVKKLKLARGIKYKQFRSNLNQFNNLYLKVDVIQIDLSDIETRNQINKLINSWSENKIVNSKECDCTFEYEAINKLLQFSQEFRSLHGLGVYYKDELIAFSINDLPDKEFGSILFLKANTCYKGMFQFIMKETIKFINTKDIRFVSLESDIGIASLRNSKLRYNPEFFLKKYKIEMNN